MGKTVQEFVAEKCKAEIYELLPGEYLEQSINDVIKANKRHDRMAQRCYKLLLQRRFRK